MMNQKTALTAALVAGYVIGRTKKGKVAIAIALWLTGKSKGDLLRDGLNKIGEIPAAKEMLDQVRGPLSDAARRAAVSTLENGAGSLSTSLQQRTNALSGNDSPQKTTKRKTASKRTTSGRSRPASRSGGTRSRTKQSASATRGKD